MNESNESVPRASETTSPLVARAEQAPLPRAEDATTPTITVTVTNTEGRAASEHRPSPYSDANRSTPRSDPLQKVVATEPVDLRATRKRKLLGLLQSFDTAKLDELAQQSNAPRISQLLTSRKRTVPIVRVFRPSDLPAAVGLFPSSTAAKEAIASAKKPRAKTLKQLERQTLSLLESRSPFYRQRAKKSAYRTFSLRFQECSIMAMARYSTLRANGRRNEATVARACVDVNFRRCGLCKKWGHYENQCSRIQPLEAYRLSGQAVAFSPRPSSSPQTRSVCVEQCDGFMIEQQATPRPKSPIVSPMPPVTDTVNTVIGGFQIKASAAHTDPDSLLKVGDAVAWSLPGEKLATGVVESVDNVRHIVKARCCSIASRQDAAEPSPHDALGQVVSLPFKSVRRAQHAQRVEHEPKPDAHHRSRGTTSRRRIEEMNEDGTLASRTVPILQEDGTYRRPRGKNPTGMEWDAIRGLWTKV